MTKIPLALATLAIATASTIALTTAADAGRGHRGHFRFHHHFHAPIFRHHEPAPVYVYRKPKVVKPAAAASSSVPVKYADGEGRQFDRASKTWFDGVNGCWKGGKTFAYRGGAWFYGNARWVQTSNGWGVSSGDLPDQVDCAEVKAFAGKIKPVSTGSEAPAAEAPKPAAAIEAPARAAERQPELAQPKAPEATANASDCKKYLPSLGETVSVPCTQ
jgi:hypothetical protein